MSTPHPVIRVILVDDSEYIHQNVGDLLKQSDEIDLIASGNNGQEAVELCQQHDPDVVLMDVSMPVMNGIAATSIISKEHPNIRILAMSGIDDTSIVQGMIAAGAAGYVLKEAHPDELLSSLRAVYSGQSVFSSKVVKPLISTSTETDQSHANYNLTPREQQVLALLGQGFTNGQIAFELNISQPTVRFHTQNILEKLDVGTRSEALVLAARSGLI